MCAALQRVNSSHTHAPWAGCLAIGLSVRCTLAPSLEWVFITTHSRTAPHHTHTQHSGQWPEDIRRRRRANDTTASSRRVRRLVVGLFGRAFIRIVSRVVLIADGRTVSATMRAYLSPCRLACVCVCLCTRVRREFEPHRAIIGGRRAVGLRCSCRNRKTRECVCAYVCWHASLSMLRVCLPACVGKATTTAATDDGERDHARGTSAAPNNCHG